MAEAATHDPTYEMLHTLRGDLASNPPPPRTRHHITTSPVAIARYGRRYNDISADSCAPPPPPTTCCVPLTHVHMHTRTHATTQANMRGDRQETVRHCRCAVANGSGGDHARMALGSALGNVGDLEGEVSPACRTGW
jgi:hypothetical protein